MRANPPRPCNAFILYRSDVAREISSFGCSWTQAAISQHAATRWRQETREVRTHYQDLSKQKVLEHQIAFPDYKYKPRPPRNRRTRKLSRNVLGESSADAMKKASPSPPRKPTHPVSTESQILHLPEGPAPAWPNSSTMADGVNASAGASLRPHLESHALGTTQRAPNQLSSSSRPSTSSDQVDPWISALGYDTGSVSGLPATRPIPQLVFSYPVNPWWPPHTQNYYAFGSDHSIHSSTSQNTGYTQMPSPEQNHGRLWPEVASNSGTHPIPSQNPSPANGEPGVKHPPQFLPSRSPPHPYPHTNEPWFMPSASPR